MGSRAVIWVIGLVVAGGQIGSGAASKSNCKFPAIYNFGDSNSDTGGRSAAMGLLPSPNGGTFFGKPSGRVCDGRVIMDFIAENLGLPHLSAYLNSIGTNFRHGANFAISGAPIREGGGYSPFYLDLQISQFIQFKSRATELFKNPSSNGNIPFCKSILPRPKDFSKALYVIDIGQNDLAYGFQYSTMDKVRAYIPDLVDKISQAVHQLYDEGARVFWIHNTGPIGCLPFNVLYYKSKIGKLDQNGCVGPQNEVAKEFNRQLKDRVSHLRAQLLHAAITYVDMYSAKYTLISNAKHLGFVDPMEFCCGSFHGYHVYCGKRMIVNGTVYDNNSCDDPSKHISWDGIHYTQAANMLLAKLIINGSKSDPPVSVANACHTTMNT